MSGKSGPQRLNPGAIQRHNAYRNKYHAEPAEMSAVTQSDIQFVDLGLQDAVKLKRGGISVKEKAMQEKIAAAAAEIKRSKLPDHILTGIKVLAVIANIVLVVLGTTDEIFALDLDISPLAEAVSDLFKEGVEKVSEAREMSREETLQMREDGLKAMEELTGMTRKKPEVIAAYRDLLVKTGKKKAAKK